MRVFLIGVLCALLLSKQVLGDCASETTIGGLADNTDPSATELVCESQGLTGAIPDSVFLLTALTAM